MINRAVFWAAALLLLAPSAAPAADIARYILPPGNYGGVPFTENSRDQPPWAVHVGRWRAELIAAW